jgi:hypothetical protein
MSKRVSAIHNSLDLGFSEYFPQMNVREITIQKNGKIVDYAVGLKELDEAIHFSLFNALGSKHPSVQIYVLDFPSDLRASLYLLLGGYYREALLCIRGWLEMRLLGVFFGQVETDSEKYRMWKRGKFEAPIGRGLIKKLFARAEFRKADEKYQLRKHLSALYADLSKFTHGAGLTKYDLQKRTDNVPRYNPESVLLFDRLIRRTFVEIVFSLYVAYGEAAVSSLTEKEVRNLIARLPRRYGKVLGRAYGKN